MPVMMDLMASGASYLPKLEWTIHLDIRSADVRKKQTNMKMSFTR